MATALITGATAGIGAAYAKLLAKEGFDLVLVARDLPRLKGVAKELSKLYKIKAETIKADLTKPAQLAKVEKRLANNSKPIEVLINNAGFGLKDSFLVSNLAKEQELLDVLVTAPMRLSHAVLPGMIKRNSGSIVNVSSVASFIAGGTYSAAKSYLTVFSEYLHTELRDTNIKVSALCPGFTRTEFHARGKMKMSGLPNYMWTAVDQVVAKSWRYVKAGKVICIPGWQYMLLSSIARIAPRPLVRKLGIKIRRKQR
ncbi:MAG: SDR family oxidoreductase [Candidatus Nanopelagicus sp.]|jgi:short-subunit dehydrogenase|nr:SDR family oxidoreductase [Candidatus Nanopelagicus sp.]